MSSKSSSPAIAPSVPVTEPILFAKIPEVRLGPSLEMEESARTAEPVVGTPLRSLAVSSSSSSSSVGAQGLQHGNFVPVSENGMSRIVLEAIRANKKIQPSDVQFSDWLDYITLGIIDLYVDHVFPGSKIRSVNKTFVNKLSADIQNPRKGWTPQVGTPMYVMKREEQADEKSASYLCVEGMHRVLALQSAGYDKPVRFNLVRQLSLDDMIFTAARLNQQGDNRYVGNLISDLETHRRALEVIVEKELQKRQNTGPEAWLEISTNVKPSDIWYILDPHEYKELKGLQLVGEKKRGSTKSRVHNMLRGGAPNKYRLPHSLLKRLTTPDFETFIQFLKDDYEDCVEREVQGLPQKYPSLTGSSGYRLSLINSGLEILGGYLERIEPDYKVDFSQALFLVMKWLRDEYRNECNTSAPSVTRVADICRRVVGALQERQRVSEYFWPREDPILGH